MARKKHGNKKRAAELEQIAADKRSKDLDDEATRILDAAGGLPDGEPSDGRSTVTEAVPEVVQGDVAEIRRIENITAKLTPEERAAVGMRLCDTLTKRDEVEDEKKATAKEYADKLGGLDAEIVALKKTFEAGVETREIEVVDVTDYNAKKVRTLRADNREQIAERDLRPHELQMELRATVETMKAAGASDADIAIATTEILSVASRSAEAADLTEEQTIASSPEEAEQLRAARLANEAAERDAEAAAELHGHEPRIAQQGPRALLRAPRVKRHEEHETTSASTEPDTKTTGSAPAWPDRDPFDPDQPITGSAE